MTLFRIIENGILKLKKLYATMVNVDASAFSKNFGTTDDTVQKCLDKVDQFDLGGGSLPEGTFRQTLCFDETNTLVTTYNVDVDKVANIVTINSRADLLAEDLPEIACHEGHTVITGRLNIAASASDEAVVIEASTSETYLSDAIRLNGNEAILTIGQFAQDELRPFQFTSSGNLHVAIQDDGDVLVYNLIPEYTGNLNNVISNAGILEKEGINLSYRFNDYSFDTTTLTDVPELYVELVEGNVYKIDGFFVIKSTENLIFRDGFKFGFNSDDDYIGYCNIIDSRANSLTISENDIYPKTVGTSVGLTRRVVKINSINPIVYELYDAWSWLNSSYPPPHYWMISFEFLVESNSTQNFYFKIAKERDNAGSQILMNGAWLKATLQSGY